MRNKIFGLFIAVALVYFFAEIIPGLNLGEKFHGVSEYYAENGVKDHAGSNLVTSIVTVYRGLDTLGEVTVLFVSAAGLSFLLGIGRKKKRTPKMESSPIVQTSTGILLYPIILFGIYIFIHGHLTPGGGFQGGAVAASGAALILLTFAEAKISHKALAVTESIAGFFYVGLGFITLWFTGSFLANKVIGIGEWGELFSAGIIPIIYILIGLKVGAELSGLLADLFHYEHHMAVEKEESET